MKILLAVLTLLLTIAGLMTIVTVSFILCEKVLARKEQREELSRNRNKKTADEQDKA